MFTNRETTLIRIALWVILIGFITGALLSQTSPFVAIASLFVLSTACVIRNDLGFKQTVIISALNSVVVVLSLLLYIIL